MSPNIDKLHRARKPLKPPQPDQIEQAIERLARVPIHQAMVSNIVFSATDHDTIAWTAGFIVFSNGVSYDIAAGTLDISALTYIYHIRGDNALWNSTTYTDAIGYNKTLIAVAQDVTSPGKAKIATMFGTVAGYLDLADIFDANTILKADADNTPEALTVAEQTLVGRITAGEIAALTAAQVKTLLAIDHGADLAGLGDDDHTQYQKESEKGAASGYASLDASTKVVEQPASITDHLEATPTNGETTKAPQSDWAFDHDADEDAHHAKTHGAAEHTDVERTIFYPVGEYFTGATGDSTMPGIRLDAATDELAELGFKVPSNFVSFTSLKVVWVGREGVAGEDWVCDPVIKYGAASESIFTHSDTPANTTINVTTLNVRYVTDIGLTLSSLALGDFVGVKIQRDADNAADTYTADIFIQGVELTYTASQ